jgi:DNA replication protein DnaC
VFNVEKECGKLFTLIFFNVSLCAYISVIISPLKKIQMREIIEGFANLPNAFNYEQCINTIDNVSELIIDEINTGYLDDEDDRFKTIHQALIRVANSLETLKTNNNGI